VAADVEPADSNGPIGEDVVNRSQRVRVGILVAVLGAGCSGGHAHVISDPGTTAPSTPRLDAVLKDGGLQLSATRVRAGRYLISFRDLRTHPPTGDRVELQFGASGPRVALVTVPGGGERVGTLLQNDVAWVTVNGTPIRSAGGDSLEVDPTKQFPTPVT
jgi:hypothetical protein